MASKLTKRQQAALAAAQQKPYYQQISSGSTSAYLGKIWNLGSPIFPSAPPDNLTGQHIQLLDALCALADDPTRLDGLANAISASCAVDRDAVRATLATLGALLRVKQTKDRLVAK